MMKRIQQLATALGLVLALWAGHAQAQLVMRVDTTGAGGPESLKTIIVERGSPGKTAITFLLTGGRQQKVYIPHAGPDECYQKPDSSIVLMKSNSTYEVAPFVQDGDVFILGLLGYDDMHFAYPFKIRRGRFSLIIPDDNMYWQVQSHWHMNYVFYDSKRNVLVDFNRKSWIDTKHLTAGVYTISGLIRFRGEILLEESEKMRLSVKDLSLANFYRDFMPFYQKKMNKPLKYTNSNPIHSTEPMDKRPDRLTLDNKPYHLDK